MPNLAPPIIASTLAVIGFLISSRIMYFYAKKDNSMNHVFKLLFILTMVCLWIVFIFNTVQSWLQAYTKRNTLFSLSIFAVYISYSLVLSLLILLLYLRLKLTLQNSIYRPKKKTFKIFGILIVFMFILALLGAICEGISVYY